MKLRKQILLSAVFTLSLMLSNKGNAQNIDTRKGWDLRGYGFDTAMSFVVRYSPQFNVLVGVATNDKLFIDEVKSIIRKLDKQGYENIGLIVHDQYPPDIVDGLTHNVFFYINTYPKAAIVRENDIWYFASMENDKVRDIIDLRNENSKYPLTLIHIKLKTLLKK